ncbi:sugar transferase [Algoriphagus sp. Y33]|uniref:sugar transferase n=1 Tax=Algoriphagus sp. Y33 TaxID=2772483 RepID=UPI00177F317F|nr:sugar transferase [Algoriphagus sp. Y33]
MSLTIDNFIAVKDLSWNKDFIYKSYSINHLDSFQVALKRFVDLSIFTLFFVFVGWWLFVIIALCISLESKGPVIFKQLRHGKNNRPFYCYKFRTMKHKVSSEFLQAQKNDPRITRVGSILRRTSLDELPQLFNILIGEMSIVGPRPHALSMNRDYSYKINDFMFRHMVKPGLTGLAQANGFRGEIKDESDMNHRLAYDFFYIKKWSLTLDFIIILTTFKCIFFNNKNAY